MPDPEPLIYTIGHSTHSQESFLALLHQYDVEQLADVRRFPGSVRYPHFNQVNLAKTLPAIGLLYMHWPGLGGKRRPTVYSRHKEWKNGSFRAFADYMDTREFAEEFKRLEEFASDRLTVIMCSEGLWWRCHRALISDRLKAEGWKVMHINSDIARPAEEHPFTAPYLEQHLL